MRKTTHSDRIGWSNKLVLGVELPIVYVVNDKAFRDRRRHIGACRWKKRVGKIAFTNCMTYLLHRDAERELEAAFQFYKNKASMRVAQRFLDEFERVAILSLEFEIKRFRF